MSRYIPPLSFYINVKQIPGNFGSFETGISNIFSKLFVQDLISDSNGLGEDVFYSFLLVSKERLAINLGGTDDFSLVFNPGFTPGSSSEFPVHLRYSWKILQIFHDFQIENFDYSALAFYDILLNLTGISDFDLFSELMKINNYEDDEQDPFEDFVMAFNLEYNPSTALIVPSEIVFEERVENILTQLQSGGNDYQITEAIFIIDLNPTGNFDNFISKTSLLFKNFIGSFTSETLKNLLLPDFSISFNNLNIALEFPRSWLKPVDAQGNVIDGIKSKLTYNVGILTLNSLQGFDFKNADSFDLTPSQIGDTGLLIDIDTLKFDFRTDRNIPEADADGRPNTFQGIFAESVSITLPKKWFNNVDNTTLQIAGRNLLIGTGGISGTIALETVGGLPNNGQSQMKVDIGSWEIGFSYFDLNFHQNVITESNIAGTIKIPKLKDANDDPAEVGIKGHINEEGDFNLTASEPDGIPLTLFNFVTINFLTLELGKEDDNFYIGTSCQIWFDNPLMNKILNGQKIEIPQLRIYDNGSIEIVGGNSFIPTNISIDLGPVEIAVTGIHFGSTQLEHNGVMRKYNYWGFDGAMSLDPLGIDARGEGIKYYYTVDNDEHNGSGDSFLHIQTIEVDLIIPGSASPESAVAIIHGMLSLPDPGETPEYIGEISLKLPKAKIAGGAAMKMQPRYPAFVIDAFLDLPAPIPIGPLGIYGFRGLLGFRYVAEKEAIGLVSGEDTWYEYYTYPPKGIHVSKFSGPERTEDYDFPFSIGAGAVLGTSFDSGTLISLRVMILLSLPTLFMIEGRASILSARLGLDDSGEPPFFAFIAWGDNSIESGMGADFQIPKSGLLIDLYAEVQSGFFFDYPSAWYVNFGTREVPISARILTIITAQSYLMLSAQGIEAGARVDFELKKQFGPAKVHLAAYVEVGGYISFERPQIGGYIAAGGIIDIDIWIVAVSLSLDAIFSAEAPKPFLIYAELNLRVCVKILFAKVCKSFTVELKWEKDKSVDRTAIPPLPRGVNGIDRTDELVKGIHMLTNESFDLHYSENIPSVNQIDKIIPLDTYIEFKVEKGLVPSSVSDKIGGYTFPPEKHVDLIPPQKVIRGGREVRQVKHKYSIEDIEVKAWNGSNWVDYHPFEAVVPASERPNVSHLRIGYWQIKEKQYDTIRLLATTPFTYMEAGEPGWSIPEIYGITPSTLFCSEEIKTEDCSNVLNKALGTKYYPPTQFVGHFINGAYYTLSNVSGYELVDGNIILVDNEYLEVTDDENVFNFEQSLSFNNYNQMVIILPEKSVEIKLKLTTKAQGATIKYYKSIINDLTSIVEYELVNEEYKTKTQLNSVVSYANENDPITKIIIQPDDPDVEAIISILEQIAELFEITYESGEGGITVSEPSNVELYNALLEQLAILKGVACSEKKDGQDPDCTPHPVICPLYQQLLQLFNDCFAPVETSEQVDENINCFEQFNFILKQIAFYIETDEYLDEYENFVSILIQIHNLEGHHEQIIRFLNLKASAQILLNIIESFADCDCIPAEQNKCNTSLQEICWLTLENHEYNQTIPGSGAIEGEFQDMIEGVQTVIQPIWRPNTSYYVKYKLKDEVDNGESNPGLFDYYYSFKTVGPLGHYHKNPNVDYIKPNTKPDQYALTSLRSYIDYNRSYPNADGSLLRAKPTFYGNEQCEIKIFFIKPMTSHLLKGWNDYLGMSQLDGAMHIAIKDPITDVIIPYPLPIDYNEETVPVPAEGDNWVDDDDPRIPVHIQVLINMIENGEIPCEIELGELIAPASQAFTVKLTNLKPRKLYTALLYNAFERSNNNIVSEPIHEFVFQTSRYLDFESQVNSYLLNDGESLEVKQAVYDIEIAIDNIAIEKAYDIIVNPESQVGDPLENLYQHLFDRVIEGVFGITPLDPAETTEFNKITNINTGNIIAILIRNPEPFNNPKIPLELAQNMIQVTLSNGNVDNSYTVLHSNDYSQTIIMNNTNNITASIMNFSFKYMKWNDMGGVEEETVELKNILINA
ncbi:MAG: hypothetical protein Q8O88_00515 [bacterium]|nr:hypothetical protein [bacterium]